MSDSAGATEYEDLDMIRHDGNLVIRRLDRVYDLLESERGSGADPATIDALEAAQSLIEGAQGDVVEMQELSLDVKKSLEADRHE